MNQPLRVLLVEDSAVDAALLRHELRRAYEVVAERVDSPAAFVAALDRQPWDAIISDMDLPGFGGLEALQLALGRGLDLPLLIVSGRDDEATALAAMRAGAHDYVVKGQLERLLPALERELREAEQRRARRQAEHALQAAYQQIASVLESISDAFYAVDHDWRLTYVNRRAEEYWGRRRTELLGRSLWEVFPQLAGQPADDHQRRALREGVNVEFEMQSAVDGRWLRMSACPTREGLAVYFHDITARKQAEAQQGYHAALLAQLNDAVVATDTTFVITAWNRAAEDIYGWTAAEAIGRQATDLLQTTLVGTTVGAATRQLVEAGHLEGEVLQRHKGGHTLHLEFRNTAVREAGTGRLTGYVSVNRDISARHQAEAALRLAKHNAERAADEARRAAARVAHLQAVTSRLSQALIPAHVLDVIVQTGAAALGITGALVALLAEGEASGGPADWAVLEVVRAVGYPDEALVPLRRVPLAAPLAITQSIRERQPVWLKSPRAVAARFPLLQAAHQAAGHQAAAVLPLEISGRPLGALVFSFAEAQAFSPDQREFLRALAGQCAQAIERARLYEGERLAHLELEERVRTRTAELREANDKLAAANQVLARESAERQRVQAQLERLREEERARIAREIHDELGGALTALKLEAAWLARHLPAGIDQPAAALRERAQSLLQQIDHSIASVRRIATQLRPGVLDDLGLGPALEWLAQDFEARTSIRLALSLRPSHPELEPEVASGLFRIVQEALTNVARHAEAARAAITLEVEGGSVRLQVRDNGRGLAPDALQQAERRGSLGLAGMRERARLLGGTLEVASQPGHGTLIGLTLPARALQPSAPAVPLTVLA